MIAWILYAKSESGRSAAYSQLLVPKFMIDIIHESLKAIPTAGFCGVIDIFMFAQVANTSEAQQV